MPQRGLDVNVELIARIAYCNQYRQGQHCPVAITKHSISHHLANTVIKDETGELRVLITEMLKCIQQLWGERGGLVLRDCLTDRTFHELIRSFYLPKETSILHAHLVVDIQRWLQNHPIHVDVRQD